MSKCINDVDVSLEMYLSSSTKVFVDKEFLCSASGDVFFLYDGPYGHTSLERNCEKINKIIQEADYEDVALVSIRNLSFRTPIWSVVSISQREYLYGLNCNLCPRCKFTKKILNNSEKKHYHRKRKVYILVSR